MGYVYEEIDVVVRLSNHNDDRADRDRALADELRARIDKLCKIERYARIDPQVYS